VHTSKFEGLREAAANSFSKSRNAYRIIGEVQMNDHAHRSADGTPETRIEPEQAENAGFDLEKFITEVADPVIASVLRRQFYVSLRPEDFSRDNQEALEIASEVRAKLIPKLIEYGSDQTESRIENLEAYVRTVAANTFRDCLRKRRPRRQRLSNRLRYIIKVDERYAMWQASDGTWLCGETAWRDGRDEASVIAEDELVPNLQVVVGEEGGTRNAKALTALVSRFFELHSGPVRFGSLVSALYEILHAGRALNELETQPQGEVRDNSRSLERRYEDRASLADLWDAICTLPAMHKAAVLLNLRAENGDNALPLFPALRIASVRDIAEALDISAEKLSLIWDSLPLDDLTIAEWLGLTRQQVINLRHSARVILKKKRS
jgi:DNA-directed RNA polymerase specialized sigma24 family protein